MTDASSSSDGEFQVKRPRISDQDEIQPKNVRPKRKVNCKKNSADFEPENDGICHIDRLPALVLTKIFEHLDYPNRLRMELVSPRWQKIAKEESWRHFRQCKLPKPHSSAHLKTLFNRTGKYIQELIFAPNSPEGKLNQYSVGRLSDWIHLMPKLHTICIVDRQLAHREKSKFEITSPLFYNQLRKIKCLYLEGCLNKTQRANNFDTMRLLVGECTSLYYLGLTKSRYYSAPAGVIDGNRVYNENETHCQIGSNLLRQLRIDDSFQIERILFQKEFPQLIGLSLSFNGVHNFVQICQNPKIRPIFRNLKQFELGFIREPGKNILEYVEKVIPFLGNVRILSMEYIDGNILSKIVQNCPNIEQFEYLCHKENILDNFPQICQLTKLRFLWFRHYSGANPKETPKIVLETLKELAGKGKLEHLSINMKLPMDLVLHIVQECPFLDYLEYSKVPSNLSELNTKIHELSQTRQSPRPLNFRIPYHHFWKKRIGMKSTKNGQNIGHSPWLKLRHQPPRRESAVIREHLKCVFDGAGDVPEFLTLWPREDDGEL